MRDQSATYTTGVRQCDKKTISGKDNTAYKLASPNNNKKETIASENNNGLY